MKERGPEHRLGSRSSRNTHSPLPGSRTQPHHTDHCAPADPVQLSRAFPLNAMPLSSLSRVSAFRCLRSAGNTASCAHLLLGAKWPFCHTRNFSSAAHTGLIPKEIRPHFTFWPDFFSRSEQKTLLSAALLKLDSMDSVKTRRRRTKARPPLREDDENLQHLFAPDDLYDFHEVRMSSLVVCNSKTLSLRGPLRRRHPPL